MTLSESGLAKAMKKAYREDGYSVCLTESGLLIQGENWGIEILPDAVPNSIKSLIVLHSGAMPGKNEAIFACRGECGDLILESQIGTMEYLAERYTAGEAWKIKPTRLTLDGYRIWQTEKRLSVRLVDPDDQQILGGGIREAAAIGNYIYCREWFGSAYVAVAAIDPDDRLRIDHLEKVQWIPVELEA